MEVRFKDTPVTPWDKAGSVKVGTVFLAGSGTGGAHVYRKTENQRADGRIQCTHCESGFTSMFSPDEVVTVLDAVLICSRRNVQ